MALESQDYRAFVTEAILGADSSARIVDPLEMCKVRAPAMHSPGTAPEDMFKDDAAGLPKPYALNPR